jgi:hypothetical protein
VNADALLELGDHEFWLAWPRMTDAERRALPDEIRNKCFARFRELTPHIDATVKELERQKGNGEDHAQIAGAELLDSVRDFLGRFVAFPAPYCLDAATLWAAHAHMVEQFHTTPRLAVLSPEPESGKTRLLEILDLLTPNAMLILSPSVAAIFRKLAGGPVTLLFDEVDTIFTKRGKDDQNEDLRALLNAGYRRGAGIPRCVGPRHEVQDFPVFAATALAGIGDLPETVMTRAVVIRMKRRAAGEQIEQFRLRVHQDQGHELRDQLAQWAAHVGQGVGAAWPDLPEGVNDRRAEVWEPLIAIADQAGGHWPASARRAAVTYVSDVSLSLGVSASLGVRLLADLRVVFGDREAVFTEEILRALTSMEEAPWGDLHGSPLKARGLAGRLRKYQIESKQVRIGEKSAKGYARSDLNDAWSRYLLLTPPPQKETRETSVPTHTPIGSETRETSVTNCPRCGGEGCGWCEVTDPEHAEKLTR